MEQNVIESLESASKTLKALLRTNLTQEQYAKVNCIIFDVDLCLYQAEIEAESKV